MVNKQIIIGFLGSKPEKKTFDNGKSLIKFSVATTEKWKDKQTGERKEHTEWHNCVTQGKLAEICEQYLDKGSKVYVEGKTRHRSYEQDGIKKYLTEVYVNDLTMLGNPKTSSNNSSNQSNDEFEDDLPF